MSMRSIYRRIAKEHGVSVEEVRRDMKAAISHTYATSSDSITEAYRRRVPSADTVPTTEEFVSYATKEVLKEKYKPKQGTA